MNDDFNSPVLIAHLFDAVRMINSVNDKKETISATDIETLKRVMHTFVFDVLGLVDETKTTGGSDVIEGLDRKSTRLNSSHVRISYAVFCLKKKKKYS